jgi:hypothetical protein
MAGFAKGLPNQQPITRSSLCLNEFPLGGVLQFLAQCPEVNTKMADSFCHCSAPNVGQDLGVRQSDSGVLNKQNAEGNILLP